MKTQKGCIDRLHLTINVEILPNVLGSQRIGEIGIRILGVQKERIMDEGNTPGPILNYGYVPDSMTCAESKSRA